MLAPRAVPRDIIARIHQTLVESLNTPKVKEIMVASGAEAVGNSPEEFARFLQSEMVKWGKVVRAAGIKGE
jgi:tripartite-type tricarboxylate transporter receptor subunit TctC